MTHFEYVSPATLEDALDACARDLPGARIIAGGTDLIPQMRNNILSPQVLVDLRLLQLDQIRVAKDHLSIGACITHSQIVVSEIIQEKFPALAEACNLIGGPATRNRGTVGGNLINASPAADSVPVLLAYDAILVVSGKGYEKNIPLADFYLGYRKTALQPGEILKEIILPFPADRTCAKYIKMGNRRALTIAVVSAAAAVTLDEDGTVTKARIALGSVAPTPLRVPSAENILTNKELNSELIAEAAQEVAGIVNPISDIRASAEYRRDMSAVLTSRVLEEIKTSLLGGEQHE